MKTFKVMYEYTTQGTIQIKAKTKKEAENFYYTSEDYGNFEKVVKNRIIFSQEVGKK